MIRKNLGYVLVTKASKHDNEVTGTVNRLSKLLTPGAAKKIKEAAKAGNYKFVIDFHGIPTVFFSSRGGKTLYSRKANVVTAPRVGLPVGLYVSTLRVEKF